MDDQPQDPLELQEGDFEKPLMDVGTFKLMAKLHCAMMDETSRITNLVYDMEKAKADRLEKAMKQLEWMASSLRTEIPKSSVGGQQIRAMQDVISDALYPGYYSSAEEQS